MTILEYISWSELLKNTNLTAEHGNDGNRIAMATVSLKQTAHLFVQLLDERARLFANSAQFDVALRDAAAIRAILPRSGLGYLCTGDVHCQQGRYPAAIAMYDQGLKATTESDPYYQQLQKYRLAALANNSKRVDFISQLPLEIVISNIVSRMEVPSNVLYEPLYVSRGWRERIVEQSDGLDFYLDGKWTTLKEGHDQLVRFAPHVRSITGRIHKGIRLDDLFSRAHFSNLIRLDLSYDGSCHIALINGLQLIGNSLTHLVLEWDACYIELYRILESCPNLVSLIADHVDIVVSSPRRYPKMTHLSIYNNQEAVCSDDDAINFLRQFPSLLSLKLDPMRSSSVLTILHEHCPYLQELYYGYNNDYNDDVDELDLHKIEPHPNRKGITSAHLGNAGLPYLTKTT
ncbi:predicted protein [Lichtheimia corymbifera JMRC:FSU:9682]|uniref:F-box domain-containing protein n=1 Tax=Lichtheimia corymbifera JMRC:FSU:9682 TaxID=1263082 RepID=A0A068RYX9_9FUNG|nr:predicted protein [Lichtheimia corymbifera JMRC:FSU:9682]